MIQCYNVIMIQCYNDSINVGRRDESRLYGGLLNAFFIL